MRNNNYLTSGIAAAFALTALVGTSAFAESRPSHETRGHGSNRGEIRRDHDGNRGQSHRGNDSRNDNRGRSNNNGTWNRDSHSNNGNVNRSPRSDSRSTYHRETRQAFHHNGRVSRVVRYGSGYRVFVSGARYPFYVPLAYYRADRFRVGLSINLGGYYNPAGYYDYYDAGYASSRGDLRGTVESVDYRRDTFVVRNDASGSFVTIIDRDRNRNVRPGDYVEVSGDWARSGVFQAYDVDVLGYQGR